MRGGGGNSTGGGASVTVLDMAAASSFEMIVAVLVVVAGVSVVVVATAEPPAVVEVVPAPLVPSDEPVAPWEVIARHPTSRIANSPTPSSDRCWRWRLMAEDPTPPAA